MPGVGGPGSLHARVALPWTVADVTATEEALLHAFSRAVTKYSPGDERRPVRLRVHLEKATAASRAAARTLFDAPTSEFQFVRGVAGGTCSRYATADGSLAEVIHAAGVVGLLVDPLVLSAPYSTWPDLVSAPLAEHWREHGWFPVHAAAVGDGCVTALIVGASGAGKTTMALALRHGGWVWRADDKVLLADTPEGLRAISLYRNTNVAPATIDAFPVLAFARDRPPLDETNDKRSCLITEIVGRADLATFCPSVVLFPERAAHATSRVVAIGETDALLRLVAQSPASDVRSRAAAQHRVLCALARRPAFVVEAGRDVLEQPDSFASLVAREARKAGVAA